MHVLVVAKTTASMTKGISTQICKVAAEGIEIVAPIPHFGAGSVEGNFGYGASVKRGRGRALPEPHERFALARLLTMRPDKTR